MVVSVQHGFLLSGELWFVSGMVNVRSSNALDADIAVIIFLCALTNAPTIRVRFLTGRQKNTLQRVHCIPRVTIKEINNFTNAPH